MHHPGKSGSLISAIAVALCTSVQAGSIHTHHSKAELESAADLRFYERVVYLRNLAPAKFDHVHPLTGRMLSDERVYEKLLDQWQDHPVRFELAHPCLWHALDGDMIYRGEHPFVPTIDPPGSLPTHAVLDPPPGGGDPGNPGPGGSGGGDPPGGVPEPSSAVMSVSALILALLAAARRREYAWFKPRRPAGAPAA